VQRVLPAGVSLNISSKVPEDIRHNFSEAQARSSEFSRDVPPVVARLAGVQPQALGERFLTAEEIVIEAELPEVATPTTEEPKTSSSKGSTNKKATAKKTPRSTTKKNE
jgi:hypothetical protein